jgi:hypothetical protein
MANIDTVYLEQLVTRFRGFKTPNDTQRLIVALGSKSERSDDDIKKLAVLLRAEKKAEELIKARAATQKILNAEKTAARKLDVRKKIIWGAALKTASETSPYFADLMKKLYDEGFIADKDKDAVKADYDALTTSSRSGF